MSLSLRGQVGSKASCAHVFSPIFIFRMVKPWEELGSGSHNGAWESKWGSW